MSNHQKLGLFLMIFGTTLAILNWILFYNSLSFELKSNMILVFSALIVAIGLYFYFDLSKERKNVTQDNDTGSKIET